MNNQLTLGLSFLLIGILFLLNLTKVISIPEQEIFSIGFIFYGLISSYSALGKNKKGTLFVSSVIFIIGIVLFVINNYEFTTYYGLAFPSIMFSFSAGFMMLFIDEPAEKVFLSSSIILFGFGVLACTKLQLFGLISFAERISQIAINNWAFVLIALGLIILVGRRPSQN